MLGLMAIPDVEFIWVEKRHMELEVSDSSSTIMVVGGMRCGEIMKSESGSCSFPCTDGHRSGGAYIYYWPRNSANVPDNVRVSDSRHKTKVVLMVRTRVMAIWTPHPGVNQAPTCPFQPVRKISTTT
jgi:hypothetical protein